MVEDKKNNSVLFQEEIGKILPHLLAVPQAVSSLLDASTDSYDVVGSHFFVLCEANRIVLDGLFALAEVEILRRESVFHLFRIDSVTTFYFNRFNQIYGRPYLEVLAGVICKDLEKTLSSIDGGEKKFSKRSSEATASAFSFLLDCLVGSAEQIPMEIQAVCDVVSKRVKTKFGCGAKRTFLSNYFVVRFFCPALVLPDEYLGSVAKEVRESTRFLSKILLAASNELLFDTENMMFANEILTNEKAKATLFFDVLAKNELSEEQLEMKRKCQNAFKAHISNVSLDFGDSHSPERLLEAKSYFFKLLKEKKDLIKANIVEKEPTQAELALGTIHLLQEHFEPKGKLNRRSSKTNGFSPKPQQRSPMLLKSLIPSTPSKSEGFFFSESPSPSLLSANSSNLAWSDFTDTSITSVLNDLKILRAIVETESQYCDFGVHFYHLCDNVGLSFALLKGLAKLEIESHQELKYLFSFPKTISSSIFRHYFLLTGKRYLESVLSSFVKEKFFKVDLLKSDDLKVQKKYQERFQKRFQELLTAIVAYVDQIPLEMKSVIREITALVTKTFGPTAKNFFVRKSFFKIFFRSALSNPNKELRSKLSRNSNTFCHLMADVLGALVAKKKVKNRMISFANSFVLSDSDLSAKLEAFFSVLELEELGDEQENLVTNCQFEYSTKKDRKILVKDRKIEVPSKRECSEMLTNHFEECGFTIKEKIMSSVKANEVDLTLEAFSDFRREIQKVGRSPMKGGCTSSDLSRKKQRSPELQPTRKRVRSLAEFPSVSSTPAQDFFTGLPSNFECENVGLILQKHDHILLRLFILTIISLDSPVEKKDMMVASLFEMHRQPQKVFQRFFLEELKNKKEVAVVMREMSLSVMVLKYLLIPFRDEGRPVLSPLVKFGLRLSKKKKEMLMGLDQNSQGVLSSTTVKLKSKLKSAISFLFRSEIPNGLCVLCYKCVEMIRTNEEVQRVEGTPLSHWAVNSVLFLRFLIPMVTTRSLSEVESEKKEGLMLMSRLLMKLSSKSLFSGAGGGTCVFNEVVEESFGLYDQFCDEVVLKGKELSLQGEEVWDDVGMEVDSGCGREGLQELMERQRFSLLNVIQEEEVLEQRLLLIDLLRSFERTLFPQKRNQKSRSWKLIRAEGAAVEDYQNPFKF